MSSGRASRIPMEQNHLHRNILLWLAPMHCSDCCSAYVQYVDEFFDVDLAVAIATLQFD